MVDVYGQIFSREFGFRLIERKVTVRIQYKVDQVVFMICSSGASNTATNSFSYSYPSWYCSLVHMHSLSCFIVLILLAVLTGVCGTTGVPGTQRFDCDFTNNVVSVTCSFDGGAPEDCQLPLVVEIERFGTDNHTVVLTATDEFGQTVDITLRFQLSPPRKPAPPSTS